MFAINILAAVLLLIASAPTSQAACSIDWFMSRNSNVGNGVNVSAVNVSDCQSKCLANASCNGVDWNPYESIGRQCWLSGPWSWGGSRGQAYGVTHYELLRSSDCTECRNAWSLSINTNVNGGSLVSTAANLDDCQLTCIAQSDCQGIDWNPTSPAGRRCWLIWPWSGTRNNGTSFGVMHYDFVRMPGCPLVGAVAVSKFGGFVSVNPSDMSLTISANRQDAVLLVAVECLAVDQLGRDFVSRLSNFSAKCISIYSAAWPGWYVREKHGRLYLDQQSRQVYPDRFAQDASFIISGDQFFIGFETLQTTVSDWFFVSADDRSGSLNVTNERTDNKFNESVSMFMVKTLPTAGPRTMTCPNIWTRIDKVGLTNGGIYIYNYTADDAFCRTACIAYPNCSGVTFNRTGCFLAVWSSNGPYLTYSEGSTHWDLMRTSFIGPCRPGCISSWLPMSDFSRNLYSYWSQAKTEQACREECLANSMSCDGINFTSNGTVGGLCYLYKRWYYNSWPTSNQTANQTLVSWFGVNHVYNGCGSCGVSLSLVTGMSDTSAVLRRGPTDQTGCYTACVNDNQCTGFEVRFNTSDSNANNSMPTGTCYHSLKSTGGLSLRPVADGTIHSDIMRKPCGNGCVHTWSHYGNSNMNGATVNLEVDNEFDCRRACINNATCTGIDWNFEWNLCYLTTASNSFQRIGTAPGWNHFILARGAMCD